MNNKDFKSILDGIKKDITEQNRDSKILVVDFMNTFLRCFSIIHIMNIKGHHVGGLTGFLKSLGYAIKTLKPTRVILVMDGIGGSDNRKNLFPDYKGNRNTKRVTNWEGFDSREDENDSMSSQIARLIDYLKELPLDMIVVDGVEADDIIAYLALNLASISTHVTLMSSDQDFLQLVNKNISVYSPTSKIIFNPENVKKEHGVSAVNFLTKKILMGDSSDNIPGVQGLGPKKLDKLFPELKDDKPFLMEDVYNKCKQNEDILLNSRILNFKYQLDINHQLMDLSKPNIAQHVKDDVEFFIKGKPKKLNSGSFIKMYKEDVLDKAFPNIESWLNECFRILNTYNSK
jgi:DNA polymerase-1